MKVACLTPQRKIYQRRPGIVAAAKSLGVTYSHLRRVVAGERPGRNLLARYKTLIESDLNLNQGTK
jgi:hypothetical protein